MESHIDIIFICLPPAQTTVPSPAFSYLKSYLHSEGIKSDIIYANIRFRNCFKSFLMNDSEIDDLAEILPFLWLMNKKFKLKKDEYFKMKYLSTHPNLFLYDKSLLNEVIQDFEKQYEETIDNIVNQILLSNAPIVGFTSKFYQWLPSVIVAYKIKEANPNVKIVSGGWSNSQSSVDFMTIHHDLFDYSIWGEGEIPLSRLIKKINYGIHNSAESIDRLVYFENNRIKTTNPGSIASYVDYDSRVYIPDFWDYTKEIGKVDNIKQLYPIERGRGCNWNKCTFCYLSQGYKFRIKPNNFLISEIRYIIETYGIKSFFFTDNDVIGSNLLYFDNFLDDLINLRKDFPDIEIKMSEIISKGLNKSVIKKMQLAGFKSLQLGIEAISEELLAKINKKQSVLDNFFVIKTAIRYGIEILGANLIYSTPSETSDMVLQTIDNLHHFRFILSHKNFSFNLIPLGVANYSRYLNQIRKDHKESDWKLFDYHNLVDDRYLDMVDPYSLFDFVSSKKANECWADFERVHQFYKESNFSYTVELTERNYLNYKEYVNAKLVKDIVFENKIYSDILKVLNENKYSIEDLTTKLGCKSESIPNKSLIDALYDLQTEGLIWIDSNNEYVVSIIDVI